MLERRKIGNTDSSAFLKRWAANGAWAAAWGTAFGMCVGVFGEAVALASVTLLAAAITAVWFSTGRRNEEAG